MIGKQMKDLAWNTFKKTGNINTFLEFKQIEEMQKLGIEQIKNIQKIENFDNNEIQNQAKNIEEIQYGNHQNEGNNPFRK